MRAQDSDFGEEWFPVSKPVVRRMSMFQNRIIISLILSIFLNSSCFANALYPFDSPTQAEQFERLIKKLRCLVCQNQDLAESQAPLAKDLKMRVYHLVKEGRRDDEILTELTDRFGDYILFEPPLKMMTWLLWYGPWLMLALGCLIFYRISRKKP